jgi:hypothetical protein
MATATLKEVRNGIASTETDVNNADINVKAEAKSMQLTYKYKDRQSFDTREEAEAYKKFNEEILNEEKEELKFFCGLAEFDTFEEAEAWKKFRSHQQIK